MISLLQHIVVCMEENRDGSLFQINQCIQSKSAQRFAQDFIRLNQHEKSVNNSQLDTTTWCLKGSIGEKSRKYENVYWFTVPIKVKGFWKEFSHCHSWTIMWVCQSCGIKTWDLNSPAVRLNLLKTLRQKVEQSHTYWKIQYWVMSFRVMNN